MKLYVSGPMSGYDDRNRPTFNRVSEQLRRMGHVAVNPVDLDLMDPIEAEDDWHQFLKRDLKYLLPCDGVVLLDGWQYSRGARLEILTALQLDFQFFELRLDQLCKVEITADLTLDVTIHRPLDVKYIDITLTV